MGPPLSLEWVLSKQTKPTHLITFVLILWIQHAVSYNATGLCVSRNENCGRGLFQNSTDGKGCEMKYYKRNSTECSGLYMDKDAAGSALGNVTLMSYIYLAQPPHIQTAFRLSFSDIPWKLLRMRYQRNDHPEINICRDFEISDALKVMSSVELVFDCLWSDATYENLTYQLELIGLSGLQTEYRKLVFKVPNHKLIDSMRTSLKEWHVFLAVDVSSKDRLTLHFQTLPFEFGVENYQVILIGPRSSRPMEMVNLSVPDYQREVTKTFETEGRTGAYVFKVKPIHPNCGEDGCSESVSPQIVVVGRKWPKQLAVTVLILTLIVVFVGLCAWMIYNKRHHALKMKTCRKVLLIYTATHEWHMHVVKMLSAHLRAQGLQVLLDREEIPDTDHKNPYTWYNNTLPNTDVVLLVSSPRCCPGVYEDIYPNIDNVAIRLLTGNLANLSFRYARVLLPYCSKSDFPPECPDAQNFKVPAQFHQLLAFIKEQKINLPRVSSNCETLENLEKSIEEAKAIKKVHSVEKVNIVLENESVNTAAKHAEKAKQVSEACNPQDIHLEVDEAEKEALLPHVEEEVDYLKLGELNLSGEDCGKHGPHSPIKTEQINGGIRLQSLKL